MRDFAYGRAQSVKDALDMLAHPETVLLAGGTELLNWMRIGISAPSRVVDLTHVESLYGITELEGGGLRIGSLAKLNDVALDDRVRQGYPVLSSSILKAASAQIRNLATIGGNPMQRVRCQYFRADEETPCNKRKPGSGCAALHGINDRHAIFGWTDECVAVQPSDPAVALAALDATIVTARTGGGRSIPAREFHVLPDSDPAAHNVLAANEIIVAIVLPRPWPHSAYLKLRDRESYEYATVSAAVALDLDGNRIRGARVALGSVAMRPWRLDKLERRLAGVTVQEAAAGVGLEEAFADARPLSGNAHKVLMAKHAVQRTLATAGGLV